MATTGLLTAKRNTKHFERITMNYYRKERRRAVRLFPDALDLSAMRRKRAMDILINAVYLGQRRLKRFCGQRT
jgi:hypothetical protein